MRFKNPGGQLSWLAPVLSLAGFFLFFFNVREGSIGLATIYGTLGLLSFLVWFDQKWVAIPLIIYFSLAILGGIFFMFAKGFSWMLLGRLAVAGSTQFELWVWSRRVDD